MSTDTDKNDQVAAQQSAQNSKSALQKILAADPTQFSSVAQFQSWIRLITRDLLA